MRKTVFFLMGMITFAVFAVPAPAELYKYIDNRGIVRYTDNIEAVPERYRSQIAPPAPAVPETPPAAPAPVITAPKKSAPVPEPQTYVEKPSVKKPDDIKAPEQVAAAEKTPSPGPMIVTDSKEMKESPAPAVAVAPAPETAVQKPEPAPKPATDAERPVATETSAVKSQGKITEEPLPAEPAETAYLIPERKPAPPVDSDIAMLLEAQKNLMGKKEALDKIFLSLTLEKKALEASRTEMRDEQSIRQYNKKVVDLNERIKRFKKEETTLRDEIMRYNTLITQKQQPQP